MGYNGFVVQAPAGTKVQADKPSTTVTAAGTKVRTCA
jgi:hypothetical protein